MSYFGSHPMGTEVAQARRREPSVQPPVIIIVHHAIVADNHAVFQGIGGPVHQQLSHVDGKSATQSRLGGTRTHGQDGFEDGRWFVARRARRVLEKKK